MSINKRSFSCFNFNLLLLGLVVLLRASLATAQVPSLVIDSGGSTRFVKSIVFTQKGRNVVSVGDDKVVRIWDVRSGKTIRTIRTPASGCGECVISALAVSNDEKYLALGGAHGGMPDAKYAVYIYKFDTGQLLQLLKNHVSEVTSLAFSPDGRQLASGGDRSNEKSLLDSNPVRIWKLQADRWVFERRLIGHKEAISSLSFSPDGKRLVSGSHDNYVGFWNLEATGSNNAPPAKESQRPGDVRHFFTRW